MTSLRRRDLYRDERAIAAVTAAYQSGATINGAALAATVPYGTARRIIDGAGISRRPASGNRERWQRGREHLLPKIRELRENGLNANLIAKQLGISRAIALSCLRDMGLPNLSKAEQAEVKARYSRERFRAAREKHLPRVEELFKAGHPVLRIARELGISRAAVNSCLDDLGLSRPSISEGNRMGAALETAESRSLRAAAAHLAQSAAGTAPITKAANAVEKRRTLSKVGFGEREAVEYLRNLGIECDPQGNIDAYNIDIRVGNVAVEIHNAAARPLVNSQRMCRTIDLISAGISVCYVWFCAERGRFITQAAMDEVVAFIDEASRNPTPLGQYRVVRGDGQIDFVSHRQLDEFSRVAMRYCAAYSGQRDT